MARRRGSQAGCAAADPGVRRRPGGRLRSRAPGDRCGIRVGSAERLNPDEAAREPQDRHSGPTVAARARRPPHGAAAAAAERSGRFERRLSRLDRGDRDHPDAVARARRRGGVRTFLRRSRDHGRLSGVSAHGLVRPPEALYRPPGPLDRAEAYPGRHRLDGADRRLGTLRPEDAGLPPVAGSIVGVRGGIHHRRPLPDPAAVGDHRLLALPDVAGGRHRRAWRDAGSDPERALPRVRRPRHHHGQIR